MNGAESMRRVIESPLAGPERIALAWLVRRIPGRVSPDHLTFVGLLGAAIAFAGYALSHLSPHWLWLASLGLVIHWFGDSLDGTLARHRRAERPRYGFFLDQNLDVIGNLLIGMGLAASPFARLEPAFLALFAYQMLAIHSLIKAVVDKDFHVTLLNCGPTEIRVILIVLNALIIALGAPVWSVGEIAFTWVDVAVGLFGLALMAVFVWLVALGAARLRRDEPAPKRERDPH
jgi:archaetidylinositol phosphate synthase